MHSRATGVRERDIATLAEVTARGARTRPAATAVRDSEHSLSFGALHECAEGLARVLVSRGITRGHRVAILGEKNVHTVVTIFAVLRAGATYVPLDARLPDARLAFMLRDVAPSLVIAPRGAATHGLPRLALEDVLTCAHVEARLPEVDPEDLAYIMYTSGSTGRPKGVMITHRAALTFFRAHNAHARIAAGDRCMNTGPFHFDVSVLDVLLPLAQGASVTLTPELPSPKLLLRTLAEQRITHFYAVGTVLALITGDGRALARHDLSALRMLQTGAEVCNPRVINAWLEQLPQLRFLNSYGPTEASVGCVCFAKPEPGPLTMRDVPIGVPHEGTRLLLVDAELNEAASEGELWVAGPQLMQGYWRRPEEEARVFVERAGVRYYRTGDIVRRADDGQLHYVGRRDAEVKIDGQRIHLNEVQRCLLDSPHVRAAAVGTILNRHGRPRVAATLVVDGTPSARLGDALLAELAGELPNAALPVALLLCGTMPRTSTGKADLRGCMSVLQVASLAHSSRHFHLHDGVALPLARPSTPETDCHASC